LASKAGPFLGRFKAMTITTNSIVIVPQVIANILTGGSTGDYVLTTSACRCHVRHFERSTSSTWRGAVSEMRAFSIVVEGENWGFSGNLGLYGGPRSELRKDLAEKRPGNTGNRAYERDRTPL
jgi:hypothetical protein